MKKLKKLTAFIIILCICLNIPVSGKEYSVLHNEIVYTYESMEELKKIIDKQTINVDAAYQTVEAMRKLGYPEQHPMLIKNKNEYIGLYNMRAEYKSVYNELNMRWQDKKEKYPVATYIWEYLKNLDYSNQVCAGILGNIMTEVGGNTLDIQFLAQTDSYYGMCQWSKVYTDVWNTSLEVQCNYLRDTIENEFKTFGFLYAEDFSLEDFLKLDNSSDVALAFAKCYERCHYGSYELRQENARIAFEYFTS